MHAAILAAALPGLGCESAQTGAKVLPLVNAAARYKYKPAQIGREAGLATLQFDVCCGHAPDLGTQLVQPER